MEVGGQRHAPAALPRGKTRYPLYRRLGGPQGRYGRVRKISPPPGFDLRTVQPVVSHQEVECVYVASGTCYTSKLTVSVPETCRSVIISKLKIKSASSW
jgi:hypothetical protein